MDPLNDPRSLQLDWLDETRQHIDDHTWDVKLRTSRGVISTLWHPASKPDGKPSKTAVIWIGGASGGLSGPANELYPEACSLLQAKGVAGLRLDYRLPNQFEECVLDVLLAIGVLAGEGVDQVAIVGHSFGAAVAVTAGVLSNTVCAVVSLATQSYGTQMVSRLSPRPLLIIHGDQDTVFPDACSHHLYHRANEPKELVIYRGAAHLLEENRGELLELLVRWLEEKLESPNPVIANLNLN